MFSGVLEKLDELEKNGFFFSGLEHLGYQMLGSMDMKSVEAKETINVYIMNFW